MSATAAASSVGLHAAVTGQIDKATYNRHPTRTQIVANDEQAAQGQ